MRAESSTTSVDPARLLKLRLIVARHGEMDLARWWNTEGLLSARGAWTFQRGFPTTHYFAQARMVLAVARDRSRELFDPPGCMTLWHLPAEVEEQLEDAWSDWLRDAHTWEPFFKHLATYDGKDLPGFLQAEGLISAGQLEVVSKLRRSADDRAVALPGFYRVDNATATLLAAAFAKGQPGQPAIPYARMEG